MEIIEWTRVEFTVEKNWFFTWKFILYTKIFSLSYLSFGPFIYIWKIILKIMFIALPLTCMNFRAVELFVSISDVQDIIGGYLYDIFALDHTYETTLIRTHQAQNGAFSFFNTFFLLKIAIVNTCSKKILTNMIKVPNILFLESFGHKERLFKLVQHLLYS